MAETTLVKSTEVAEKYTVTPQTIYLWRRSGKIPPSCYTKVGNTYRYDLEKIQAHFDAESKATEEPHQYELFDLTPNEEQDYE